MAWPPITHEDVEDEVALLRSLTDDPFVSIAAPPYNALFDGSNERTTLASAVAAAIVAKRPLFVPRAITAHTLVTSGSISITDDLTIIGSGSAVSSITAGPDPVVTGSGESLFQVQTGVTLTLVDIALHGPATISTGVTGSTFGINHKGVSGTVRLIRSTVDGFSYGVLAEWPSGTTEGRGDPVCGTTNASATVTDTAIVTGDAGKLVQGPGIPAGTTISTVTNGVSFTMSANATATATTWLVIGGTAFTSMGAATVEIVDSSVEGNGGNAIIVQGTGKLHIRNSEIPRWGLNASDQYHGIYVHSGVSVDINGLRWGAIISGSTGWTYHTFHLTGIPQYVRLDNLECISGFVGVLTNPLIRSKISRFNLNCTSNVFQLWGDADLTDGLCSGTLIGNATSHVRPYSSSQLARASKNSLRGVRHTGLGGGVYAIDTTNTSGADFATTECEYDVTASSGNAWTLHATGTFTAERPRFSDSTFGSGPTQPPATRLAAGTRWYDTANAAVLVANGAGGWVQVSPATFPPTTVLPGVALAVRVTNSSGRIFYLRNLGGAATVTAITLQVGTQSGNIDVGIYANTGTGAAARPGARKASSGVIACPASGVQPVTIASTFIAAGDWFGFYIDNVTATFQSASSSNSTNLFHGMAEFQDGQTSLPATATPSTGVSFPWMLVAS